MLRKWSGTLILDEADMRNSDEYNEVVTILNCGFERGRPVIRAVKDNPDKIQILPVYGPKVFATRRRFKDAALEARCLTEIMVETARTDIPAVLGGEFLEEQEKLRNKLLLFRFRNYFQVNPEAPAGVDLGDIEPRLRQVSEAFISLFANQPAVLEAYRKFIRRHQQELIEQRAATVTGQVVQKLFEALSPVTVVTFVTPVTGERMLPITSGEIAEKLGLKPQVVGQILKSLGLQTKVVKTQGRPQRYILFDEARFKILQRRYIPTEDVTTEEVTKVTKVTAVMGDSRPTESDPFFDPLEGCWHCGGPMEFERRAGLCVVVRCKKCGSVSMREANKSGTSAANAETAPGIKHPDTEDGPPDPFFNPGEWKDNDDDFEGD
uniref:Uncharacterized protein n=1 Tax=Ammonifex degensii TaxID=42838 RepID=A0A7C1J8B2_9THEO